MFFALRRAQLPGLTARFKGGIMKVFRIVLSFTVAILPVAFLTWTPGSRAQDDPEGLRGSWVVTATPGAAFLCGGPQIAPPGPPFTELATYAAGGTLTETNTILNANSATLVPGLPFDASDGHGAWKKTGATFRETFRKLVFDTSGNYIANGDLQETIVIEPSNSASLSGSFNITLSFLNGAPAVCSSGSFEAVRIVAE